MALCGADHEDWSLLMLVFTYNRKEYLESLLNSLDEQTCRHFSVMVVVNGCTDDSESVVTDWACHTDVAVDIQTLDHNVFGLLAPTVVGLHDAADYVTIPGDDDVLDPGHIAHLRRLVGCGRPALVATAMRVIDECGSDTDAILDAGTTTGDPPHLQLARLIQCNYVGLPSAAFRLDLARSPLDGTKLCYAVDYWLWLHLLTAGCVILSNEPTVGYRVHAGSASSLKSVGQEIVELDLALGDFARSSTFRRYVESLSPEQCDEFATCIAQGIGPAKGREPWSSSIQLAIAEVLSGQPGSGQSVRLLLLQAILGQGGSPVYPLAGSPSVPSLEEPWPHTVWRRSGIATSIARGTCEFLSAERFIATIGLTATNRRPILPAGDLRARLVLCCSCSRPRRETPKDVVLLLSCGRSQSPRQHKRCVTTQGNFLEFLHPQTFQQILNRIASTSRDSRTWGLRRLERAAIQASGALGRVAPGTWRKRS